MKPTIFQRPPVRSSSNTKYLAMTYAANTPILGQTALLPFYKQKPLNSRKALFGPSRPQTRAKLENPNAKTRDSENISRPHSAARPFNGHDKANIKINPLSPIINGTKGANKENMPVSLNNQQKTVQKSVEYSAGSIEAYQIGRQIGRGAYAVVKEATHKNKPGRFAMKIYDKYQLWDPQKKRNVTREIDILKKLDHENIVKLFETIDGHKQLFLVFEMIRGGSLYSYIRGKEGRKLDENEAKRIFAQIVDAMRYCHHKGVVHRDLKLENLLLDENKNVKIIDFGFSTCTQPNTKLHMFCGTPSYMPPEIVNKRDYYGPPADIWSLGVLLYAMLSGKFPFKGVTEKDLYRCIARGSYNSLMGVSQSARSLISKILQVDPMKRPTCDDILRDAFMTNVIKKTDANVLLPKINEPPVVFSKTTGFALCGDILKTAK